MGAKAKKKPADDNRPVTQPEEGHVVCERCGSLNVAPTLSQALGHAFGNTTNKSKRKRAWECEWCGMQWLRT